MKFLALTQHVVFPPVRGATVELLHARLLPVFHLGRQHIHLDAEPFHDEGKGHLLMSGRECPPVNLRPVKVEDEGNLFAGQVSRVLLPRQTNVAELTDW